MLIGVVAHANRAVRQIAEHAASILAGDHGQPPGAHGMALFGAVEGVRFRLLDGDLQPVRIRVIELHDAVQFLPGVVFRPQVGNGGIAQLPLGKADVVAVAVHQAAPGTDGEHPALDLCAYGVQIRPVGKEIALASASQAPGPDGKAGLAVHLDDNEVDG